MAKQIFGNLNNKTVIRSTYMYFCFGIRTLFLKGLNANYNFFIEFLDNLVLYYRVFDKSFICVAIFLINTTNYGVAIVKQ